MDFCRQWALQQIHIRSVLDFLAWKLEHYGLADSCIYIFVVLLFTADWICVTLGFLFGLAYYRFHKVTVKASFQKAFWIEDRISVGCCAFPLLNGCRSKDLVKILLLGACPYLSVTQYNRNYILLLNDLFCWNYLDSLLLFYILFFS